MTKNVVVVTGAARGIGLAICEVLLKDDFAVVMLDLDEQVLRAVSIQLASLGGTVAVVRGDVADVESHRAAAAAALRLGQLIGWVNNAGYDIRGSIVEVEQSTFSRGIAVVLGGCFWGTATAVETMSASGQGAIVNISSIHATVGFPGYAAYAAAKGGINALTRQVAAEYASAGIRCNAIAPGVIATERGQDELDAAPDPSAQTAIRNALSPVGRWGTVDEVARLAHYLITERSGFMTGQVLVLDGGATSLARGY